MTTQQVDADAWLAAIVESSNDAIIGKSLDGRIISWNRGAQRLFGYTAAEVLGRPVSMLAAPGREDEMPAILARIVRGERVEHFETLRRHKDGRLIEISLTVSPIRDRQGQIIGASKIARDIGERRRSERLQRLLVAELNHRVKNTMAVVQAIATQTQRTTQDPAAFFPAFRSRLQALAQAHDLLSRTAWSGVSLHELLHRLIEPHLGGQAGRLVLAGPDIMLTAQLATALALVVQELATNAAKYGALSSPGGRVAVTVSQDDPDTGVLDWHESGGPPATPPTRRGFGTTLIERSLTHELGGSARLDFTPGGLHATLRFRLQAADAGEDGVELPGP